MEEERTPRVSKRTAAAVAAVRRLEAEGTVLNGVSAHGKNIASSFWGRAWCRDIESWQDYESRLPAGRSLLRAGAVVDLAIRSGEVAALVADGDEILHTRIWIASPEAEVLDRLRARCAGQIASLVDFVNGTLSGDILSFLSDPENGLMPERNELRLSCECFDDACLCRHLAAVLYGVGARLDDDPSLFFLLRGLDPAFFFDTKSAVSALPEPGNFSADELSDAFGISLDDSSGN